MSSPMQPQARIFPGREYGRRRGSLRKPLRRRPLGPGPLELPPADAHPSGSARTSSGQRSIRRPHPGAVALPARPCRAPSPTFHGREEYADQRARLPRDAVPDAPSGMASGAGVFSEPERADDDELQSTGRN